MKKNFHFALTTSVIAAESNQHCLKKGFTSLIRSFFFFFNISSENNRFSGNVLGSAEFTKSKQIKKTTDEI